MAFIGGACTHGPGAVTDEWLKNPIRSWHDIKEDKAVHMKRATRFYEALAARAVKNAHAIDIFSCALDQTGLAEMRSLYASTNGLVIMADSFESSLFRQSFSKVFEKDADGHLKMAFNATMEIKLSAGLKVSVFIGKDGCLADAKNFRLKAYSALALAAACAMRSSRTQKLASPAHVSGDSARLRHAQMLRFYSKLPQRTAPHSRSTAAQCSNS